jgi:hypothetical protein
MSVEIPKIPSQVRPDAKVMRKWTAVGSRGFISTDEGRAGTMLPKNLPCEIYR